MRFTSSHQAGRFSSQNGYATHVWRPAPPPIHQGFETRTDVKAKATPSVDAPSSVKIPAP